MAAVRIEVRPGDEAWTDAGPLRASVWPVDVLATLSWGDVVFAHAARRVLVWNEAEQLVCHVGIHWRDGTWDGRKVRFAGIGGVVTHAEHRRCGFASVAMDRAIEEIKTDGETDVALLFCEPYNFKFYEGLGWRRFDGVVFADQPSGRQRFDVMAPFIFDLRLGPRSGEFDLCGLPW